MSSMDDSFRLWLRRLKRDVDHEDKLNDWVDAELEEHDAPMYSFVTRQAVERFLLSLGKASW